MTHHGRRTWSFENALICLWILVAGVSGFVKPTPAHGDQLPTTLQEQKAAYIAEVENLLMEFGRQMANLKSRVEVAGAKNPSAFERAHKEFETHRREIRQAVEALRPDSVTLWEERKPEIQRKIRALERSYDQAAAAFD